MGIIGFLGGSSLVELGPVSDVVLFFDCVRAFTAWKYPDRDWSLLTDRLYQRYIRLEDLDVACSLMKEVEKLFSELPSSSVTWDPAMLNDKSKTWLELGALTLTQVFNRYFDAFFRCAESSKVNYEGFKDYPGYKYEAVRIVVADMPMFMAEKKRPLEEYDVLEGEPLWRR
ncbi:hypothethical protein [Ralstonia solanacearum PSI07]|nr:hypothethical protein [Ralstonia solanacearum PSI07]